MIKKIPIAGVNWEIQTNDMYGGGFDSGIPAIIIGTAMPKMLPIIFLHEVFESILTERGLRYKMNQDGGNGDIIFVFNHKEFDNAIRDLALALEGILNLKEVFGDTKTIKENKRGKASGKVQQAKVKKRRADSKIKGPDKKEAKKEGIRSIDEVSPRHCMETIVEDSKD